ncbi:hypothetical protein LTR36_010490 [Oleoguttula mirabilis]|uniref:SnoaL-like domain-containing protein n=1 Tax=Oleoguttula mirabilis TaxID=1507867 RepID=A0AAV9J483_9PEZI|nr:hypothetical protein LTR36_010490 [Oleoguttula mirabilis]
MAIPTALASLSPREAIADAMYRCIIGLDLNDWALFDSAWVQKSEASYDMPGLLAVTGLDAMKAKLFTHIGALVTQHSISNIRVDVKDGADTASLTAYGIAQHYRPGEGMDPTTKGLLTGAMYSIDVVKESGDDVWRVRKWSNRLLWLDGDRSIVSG